MLPLDNNLLIHSLTLPNPSSPYWTDFTIWNGRIGLKLLEKQLSPPEFHVIINIYFRRFQFTISKNPITLEWENKKFFGYY